MVRTLIILQISFAVVVSFAWLVSSTSLTNVQHQMGGAIYDKINRCLTRTISRHSIKRHWLQRQAEGVYLIRIAVRWNTTSNSIVCCTGWLSLFRCWCAAIWTFHWTVELLQSQKQVRLERLAANLLLPIQFESRCRQLQRFLTSSKLKISSIWFALINYLLSSYFSSSKELTVVIDGTLRAGTKLVDGKPYLAAASYPATLAVSSA